MNSQIRSEVKGSLKSSFMTSHIGLEVISQRVTQMPTSGQRLNVKGLHISSLLKAHISSGLKVKGLHKFSLMNSHMGQSVKVKGPHIYPHIKIHINQVKVSLPHSIHHSIDMKVRKRKPVHSDNILDKKMLIYCHLELLFFMINDLNSCCPATCLEMKALTCQKRTSVKDSISARSESVIVVKDRNHPFLLYTGVVCMYQQGFSPHFKLTIQDT